MAQHLALTVGEAEVPERRLAPCVAQKSLQELRALDAGSWKGQAFAGERVPTLREALGLLKRKRCRPVIEIKDEAATRATVEGVEALGLQEEAWIISFSAKALREAHELEPRLRLAWLRGRQPAGIGPSETDLARALARETEAVGATVANLRWTLISPGLVDLLHERGLEVWAWTVDDPDIAAALMRWGVDAITSNRPDLILATRRRVLRR